MLNSAMFATRTISRSISKLPPIGKAAHRQFFLCGAHRRPRFQSFASKAQSRRNKVVKRTQSASGAFEKKQTASRKASRTRDTAEEDVEQNLQQVLADQQDAREGDELETTMNKLTQQPQTASVTQEHEQSHPLSGQSAALSEPSLNTLVNDPQELPKSLPDPPADFEWLWIPHIRTGVLKPDGWTCAHGQGKWLGLDTYKAVITVDDPESCKIGLTIMSYEGIFSQPLIKNDTPMQLAEFFTSLHMKKTGPPENTDSEILPELVDSWQFTPMEGLDTYGMEYIMDYSEFDDNATRRGFQYHLHLVFNRHEDVAYEITFRAPYVFWQQAWNTHGKYMVDNLHLNWDDASPFRFQ
eukprot:gb/GECG01005992.1/.p1 GENE.gb/GECG01005992.1/~~gb/GECG01005992.1/.p1  ORF type:complete len:354 (+),score=32.71 gb/GECG01005992.1/:1-1062(+)